MTPIKAFRVPCAAIRSRLVRLPLVLLLMVGLLMSLIHCAGCELNFAASDGVAVTVSHDQGSASDTPEQQLPCHSGHCLSHVASQMATVLVLPADLQMRALIVRREQFPVALAGLPLFKPPRA